MLVNDALIDLGNTVNTNTILEKDNPEKGKTNKSLNKR